MKKIKNLIVIMLLFLMIKINAQELKIIQTILPFTDEFVTITVEVKNGIYYYNGDIIVEELEKPDYYDHFFGGEDQAYKQATAIANINRLWKKGEVPYVISYSMPSHKKLEILEAIQKINAETNINIIPKTYQRDYILLNYNGDGGCNSYIGRIGGKQVINVAEWCKTGSIMHEFFHALGFYHEHNRPDRDSYIRINWDKISKAWQSQYQKVRYAKTFGEYDFESIMHYPQGGGNFSCYNASDCNKTGNRTHLSYLDKKGINKLYHFATNKKPITTSIVKKVPIYFQTELASNQVFENIMIKVENITSELSVSFKDKNDQSSLTLEEGKTYSYKIFVECTEYSKVDNKYHAKIRRGLGSGKFIARKGRELNVYSNRNSTSGDYQVELK